MAEEKVGFGFEFGIKGDKEVKKSLEDILRVVSASGNAVQVAGGLASTAGRLFEVGGKLGAGIAIAATAMAEFARHSYTASENLRKIRNEFTYDIHKGPTFALSESQLSENNQVLLGHYKDLGLDVGNTFALSFTQRLANLNPGIKASIVDTYAGVANLFGAGIPSYESMSPEALRDDSQFQQDQFGKSIQISKDEEFQQERAKITRESAFNTNLILGRNTGPFSISSRPLDDRGKAIAKLEYDLQNKLFPPNGPAKEFGVSATQRIGVLPESFLGQSRMRDQKEDADLKLAASFAKQEEFARAQLGALRSAPLDLDPVRGSPDTTGRQDAIKKKEAEINDLLGKQLDLQADILGVEGERRQALRDWARNQNYGMWRTLGLGGVGPHDAPHALGQGLNLASQALLGHHGRITEAHATVMGSNAPSWIKTQTETLQEINKRIGKIGIPTIQQ